MTSHVIFHAAALSLGMILRGHTDKKEYWTSDSMVRSDQMTGTITGWTRLHWCYKHVQMDRPSISGERHLVPLWSLNGADNESGTELNRGEPYEISDSCLRRNLSWYPSPNERTIKLSGRIVLLFVPRRAIVLLVALRDKQNDCHSRHPLFFPPSLCVRPIRHYSLPPASHEHSLIVIFPLSPQRTIMPALRTRDTQSRCEHSSLFLSSPAHPLPFSTRSDDGRTTSTNSCHHLPYATRLHLPYLP